MIFVKYCKFPLCLEISCLFFLDSRGLEIMFDNHLVREQALLDFKNIDFTYLPRWFFLKAVNHNFGQKLQPSSLFVLGQNGPRSSV